MPYLAIDIGKAITRSAIVDGKDILDIESRPSAYPEGGEAMIRQAVSLGLEMKRRVPEVTSLGLSIPAIVDWEKGVVLTSGFLPEWKGYAVRSDFEDTFGIPVAVENNARAAALGEAEHGAGKGLESIAYITLSTGFAAAIVERGTIRPGVNNLAGQLGFAIYPGTDMTVNQLVAGSGLLGAASHHGIQTLQDLFDRARKGYPKASEIVTRGQTVLADVITWIQVLIDPSVIIFGGMMALHQREYPKGALRLLRSKWQEPFPSIVDLPSVSFSELGPNSALVGAAALAARKQG